MKTESKHFEKAKAVFHRHGGMMRTAEVLKEGIQPRILYEMRDTGLLTALSRGCYRLSDLEPMSNPDLAIVANASSKGIICLVSALAFHEITTQIPHTVDLALPAHSHPPKLDHPPIQPYWFGKVAYSEGVDVHEIDGVSIRIYNPAKTIADCFKYRNKIGLDIAVEALKFCRQRKRTTGREFQHYAKICRVSNVMSPYLEAIL